MFNRTKTISTNKKSGCRVRRNRKRHRFGTATVEMALVAPFVILLVFGSIEFTRVMMVRQSLTNAAREGCRHVCLVTTRNNVACGDIVREQLLGIVKDANETDALRITTTPSFNSFLETGTLVTTTVEIDCSDVSWLPPFFTAGAIIRASSRMSRE